MGYHDSATFADEARSELHRLQKTLRETQQLVKQSVQFLGKQEPGHFPVAVKIDNGTMKYVNLDTPHPWGFRWMGVGRAGKALE
jgi:hypothetical protein